jgi:pyruvate dehydrogenase kinase 2/3/4
MREHYVRSFEDVLSSPVPEDEQGEADFHHVLKSIFERHGRTIHYLAKGVHELKREWHRNSLDFDQARELNHDLDSFYMARISVRTLILQQIDIHNNHEGYIGCFKKELDPRDVCHHAADVARQICRRDLGDAPDVQIIAPDRGDPFPYVPEQLLYVVSELLKNALRATVEKHVGIRHSSMASKEESDR